MSRLLFFHDFSSPFCRLALESVTAAASATGVEVRPVPYELRPAPAALPSPGEETLVDELQAAFGLAAEWGVELRKPPLVPRTRKAHEAVAFAVAHGDAVAVARGIYEALWTDGADIARLDILADIGAAAGLERDPLHVALGTDEFQADVVRENDAAVAAGVEGVPGVQVGSVRASGLFPAAELEAWIEDNR